MKKMNFIVYICLLGLFNQDLHAYADQFARYEKIAWLSEKMPDFNYAESIVTLPASAAEHMIQTVQYSSHWFDDGITRTQRTITPVGKNQIRVLTQTWTTTHPQSYVTVKNAAIGVVVAGIVLSAGFVGCKGYQYLMTRSAEPVKQSTKTIEADQEDQDDQEVLVAVTVDGASDLATEENQTEETTVQDLRQAQVEPVIQQAKWGKSFLPTFVYKIVYNEYSDEERAAAQARGQQIPDESIWYKNSVADEEVLDRRNTARIRIENQQQAEFVAQARMQQEQEFEDRKQEAQARLNEKIAQTSESNSRVDDEAFDKYFDKAFDIQQSEYQARADHAALDLRIDHLLKEYELEANFCENELQELEVAIAIEREKGEEIDRINHEVAIEDLRSQLIDQVNDALSDDSLSDQERANLEIQAEDIPTATSLDELNDIQERLDW